MATNKYFRPFTYGREQDTAEDLIIESIKIYGLDVKYLPRTLVNPDALLGEDPQSEFDAAIDLEMYIKNTQGFEGEGDFLSKFNLEIRHSRDPSERLATWACNSSAPNFFPFKSRSCTWMSNAG